MKDLKEEELEDLEETTNRFLFNGFILKKFKKILVTEKDLRSTVLKNIFLEKKFYSYRPSSGRFGYRSGKSACILAATGEERRNARKEELKRSIVASVASMGGGPEPGQIPASKIIWNGPRERSDLETGGVTYTVYRLTFGVDAFEEYERRAIQIGYQVGLSTADASPGSTESQKLVKATVTIRDASVTTEAGFAAGALLHQDDQGSIKSEYSGEWYYDVTPRVVEWLKDWVEAEQLCPEDEREDAISGRETGTSPSATTGLGASGALAKTTWWSGNAETGRPVNSSSSGTTVLVVVEMNRRIFQKLISQHPGLRRSVVEGSTYAFFLPNTSEYRGIFNQSALGDAQEGIAQHKQLVANYEDVYRTFRTQPVRNLLNALAYAVYSYNNETGESQNITIDMSS